MFKYRVGQKLRIKAGAHPRSIARWGNLTGFVGIVLERRTAMDGLWYKLEGCTPWVRETMLIPVRDGDEKSSWDEFERVCGFNPSKEPVEVRR